MLFNARVPARLDRMDLTHLKVDASAGAPRAARVTKAPEIGEAVYREFLDHLIQGRRRECFDLVAGLLSRPVPLRSLYTDLYQRALYDIGARWERNEVSVATEHLATGIVDSLLNLSYPTLFRIPRCGRRAIVTCVASEYHQLGAKMVADTLELQGWDAEFLGADTPLDRLLDAIASTQPHAVALSLSLSERLPVLVQMIEQITDRFPQLRLWLGGQGIDQKTMARSRVLQRAELVGSLACLEEMLVS